MHSSVLQNDKYIEFANDNTVEVIAESRLDEGRQKKDPKADEYDGKDEKGNPVKLMKEWPNLTYDEMIALDSSPAGQYNKTGKIPYTSIVDPYTLQEIKSLPGGQSAKGLMEATAEASKKLIADHGPQMKRSSLKKYETGAKAVEDVLTKSGGAKALGEFRKLETSIAKEPEGLKTKAKALKDKILETAAADLDKADGLIGSGDVKGATAILKGYSGLLKGEDLEQRLKDLNEKLKAAATPAPK